MPTREEIRIQINGDANVRRAFATVERGLDGMRRSVLTVRNVLGGLLAAVGVGGLAITGRNALRDIGVLDDLSNRLGISTEALSELQFVADQSGVEFGTFTTGLQRAIRRISEAAQSSREASDEAGDLADSMRSVLSGTDATSRALAELGLDARELTRLAPDVVFERLADALAAVPSQYDRVRLAQKLFDSEGVALIQIMNEGAAGIRELRDQARGLGLTMSTQAAAGVAAAGDSMARFQGLIRGVRDQVVAALAPTLGAINDLATGYLQALIQQEGGAQQVAANISDAFVDGFEVASLAAAQMVNDFGKAFRVVDASVHTLRVTFGVMGRAIAAMAAASAAFFRGDMAAFRELGSITLDDLRAEVTATLPEPGGAILPDIDIAAVEAGFARLRDGIQRTRATLDEGGERPPALFNGITGGLQQANSEIVTFLQRLRETRATIGAAPAKPAEEVNTVDFAEALTAARQAAAAGDVTGALRAGEEARKLIEQMGEAGNQSDLVLKGLTANLRGFGRALQDTAAAEALTLEAEVDTSTAEGQIRTFLDTIRANPINIPVVFTGGQGIFPAGDEPAGVFPSVEEAAAVLGAR